MPPRHRELYAAHVATKQQSWEQLIAEAGVDGILLHSGSPLNSFRDDYEYPFRANPHFLGWLPLTAHPDCVLLIRPGHRPRLWYFQPEDYWHLPPADPEPWWADHFDLRVVSAMAAWQRDLPCETGIFHGVGDSPQLAQALPQGQINPAALVTGLDLLRSRKTAYEIQCIREANALALRAHHEAERAFHAGCSEFDIHLAFLAGCQQTEAELPYPDIIALNEHAAVLHYQERKRLPPGTMNSLLIDAGCTVNGYCSDITRTHAPAGSEFAELIAAMDNLQQQLGSLVAPGVDYRELHLQAHQYLAGLLQQHHLIRVAPEEAVETGLTRVFFPHGLGHFIGLQTHDVAGLIDDAGVLRERPPDHPYLRLTRVLEPGNALTVEPGLYLIDSLLRDWRRRHGPAAINWPLVEHLLPCGGIRIEDNILVTPSGGDNLTRATTPDSWN